MRRDAARFESKKSGYVLHANDFAHMLQKPLGEVLAQARLGTEGATFDDLERIRNNPDSPEANPYKTGDVFVFANSAKGDGRPYSLMWDSEAERFTRDFEDPMMLFTRHYRIVVGVSPQSVH